MHSSFSVLAVLSFTTTMSITTHRDLFSKSESEYEVNLSDADFAAASLLTERDLNRIEGIMAVDPTLGDKFEGDIDMPSLIADEFNIYTDNRLLRNAIRAPTRRWPNGVVPYMISSQYSPQARSLIARAIQVYHDRTCIRFVARDPSRHSDYVFINPAGGCSSFVGMLRGRQSLSLGNGCVQIAIVQHELMHAIGFFHEQSSNVRRGAEHNFQKQPLRSIDFLNEPYDYSSVMHYGPFAFSATGQRVIRAKRPGAERMGQRNGFSAIDLRKINKLYNCGSANRGNGK